MDARGNRNGCLNVKKYKKGFYYLDLYDYFRPLRFLHGSEANTKRFDQTFTKGSSTANKSTN